jgi:hypothetical protein
MKRSPGPTRRWQSYRFQYECRAGLIAGSARFYAGARTMNGSEFQAYHVREAARLRRLIANATTPAVKTRVIEQAEEHERLAEGFEADAEAMADAS